MIADYTGMVVGELTVLQKLPLEEGSRASRYLCRCSCGNTCIKGVSYLSKAKYNGASAHCGCREARKVHLHFGKRKSPCRV